MFRITVGIGQYEHRSEDGGITWSRHLREVPARNAPVVHGQIDLGGLPFRSKEEFWDFVTLLPCGFGVAVDHERKRDADPLTNVWVTRDGGYHWHQRNPKPRLPLLRKPSWPVERFASMALLSSGGIALAWDDPWLLDGSQSHVISSHDAGESWEYHCLGYTNPYLAVDYHGTLLTLNDGYYMKSGDGGATWQKCHFELDWPDGYDGERIALLRQVTFTGPEVGYGLVVHWPLPDFRRDCLPNVGLVTTTDNGRRWKHFHVFEGPNIGDVNERHVLDLRVR